MCVCWEHATVSVCVCVCFSYASYDSVLKAMEKGRLSERGGRTMQAPSLGGWRAEVIWLRCSFIEEKESSLYTLPCSPLHTPHSRPPDQGDGG